VQAQDFGKDPVAALREEVHRRYANKVSELLRESYSAEEGAATREPVL